MNKIASALFFSFLILPNVLFSQWKELPGPSAGAVNDICAIAGTNGAEMYAATPNGVYRTTDSAKTWKLVGLRGHNVRKITQYVVDGAEVLLTIVHEESSTIWELCRSEDSAKTWDTIFVEAPKGYQNDGGIINVIRDGNDIVICVPSLYPSDTATGIYRSSDLGDHWIHQAPVPGSSGNLLDFTIGNGSIFAISYDTLWAMPSLGIHWNVTSYPSWHHAESVRFIGNELFVGATGRLDISTNNGTTWLNPPNTGLDTTFGNISTFAVNGLTIIAVSYSGVYRSIDGADSWEHIAGTGGYPLNSNTNSISILNAHFFAAMNDGIITSPDGITWSYATHGITGGAMQLASNGSTIFASTLR